MKSPRRLMLEKMVASRPRRALQLSAAELGVCGIQVRVPQDSPLFSANGGAIVELPMDNVITPFVLDHGRWQSEGIEFIANHLPAGQCVLVDVGANIGLVTRQLMHQLPAIASAVCFEPHPGNFKLLSRNLAHLPQCRLVPAAVGSAEGELVFYEEVHNAGNYSLNLDAMRGKQYRTSVVRCTLATEEHMLAPIPGDQRSLPRVWKSDTQGFDELIMVTLPDEFWSRVHCGVMEISRIDRPAFDRARLGAILGTYAVRRFGDEPKRNVAVEQVLEFSDGRDFRHRDLFFARE
jgi:FkbM family methyltransferase